MADAKVIPFDEDSRTRRGGAPGRPRGRTGPRKKEGASPAGKGAVPLAAVPGPDEPAADGAGASPEAAQSSEAAPEGVESAEIPAQPAGAGGEPSQGAGSPNEPPDEVGSAGRDRTAADAAAADRGAPSSVARALHGLTGRLLGMLGASPGGGGGAGAAHGGGAVAGGPSGLTDRVLGLLGPGAGWAGAADRVLGRVGAGVALAGAGTAASVAGGLPGAADRVLGPEWERKVASGLAFLRRRVTGDYEVDEFGYDAELTDQVLMSLIRPLFDTYFRVEVKGVENIPAQGGALVVSNHSGTLPLDALMAQVAVHDHHPAGRHLRLLAADLVFVLPVVNELARKAGHTLACAEDAEVLLERGEVVGVMPEGFKGLGKPFAERYKLQRFGRGGFVATALKTKVPIIPCSVVGAEEIYPMVGNARTVARLLGFPYFPVTPTFPWLGPLGLVPLPTKWTIQFGEPIPTDGYPPEAAEDPMLVFNLTDQVRETIQHTLYELLVQRRSVFF